ncbi:GGL domain protein [Teladorsagia circumcincta]|uniref:Guanine nucleotide-binding protein subunit gamma n=1 Tax=Teladorsagia circumcincta TaxID=45464 RepID=A0A2G9V4S6_TELCI|nr:GGL domain protein [Teladorsagia circumcincta]
MDAMKTVVEQLRREAQMQRKNVSEVAKDLLDYCEKHKATDTLAAMAIDADLVVTYKRLRRKKVGGVEVMPNDEIKYTMYSFSECFFRELPYRFEE